MASLEQDAYAMDRYSRQIGAYGVEAMSKLIKMRVLIVGLRGVGVEVAKNLILAGPGGVTLVDDHLTEMRDLGSNFFLRKEHVGKKARAQACVGELQALNRLVDVRTHSGPVTKDLVRSHTAMIMCGASREDAIKWNEYARLVKIGFFLVGVHGLFGYGFADLGDEFQIKDKNGENPVSRIVDGIDTNTGKANEMIVHLLPPPDGQRHNMEDDDHEGWVTFDEVEGRLGKLLNGKGPFRAHHVQYQREDAKTGKKKEVFDAYALRVVVEGTRSLPPFEGHSGLLKQMKVPVVDKFRSLKVNLDQPIAPGDYSLLFTDGAKFGRGEQLHIALMGLWEWQTNNKGKMPVPNKESDVEGVVATGIKRNKSLLSAASNAMTDGEKPPYLALEEVDEDVLRIAAQFADCEFQPLCAFFGGVMAQEIVKMSGKFTPLHQWLHIDCFEVMPEVWTEPTIHVSAKDRTPQNSRYDDIIAIIGKPLHDQLLRKSTFMVGCGALGCELIKNFALLGVGCDPDGRGRVTVTDNDRIEVSNLSRQFLFREDNVGQPKSKAAANAVKKMNPDLNVVARQDLVSPDTENIFDDKFWESQDFITNALDNVKARLYVDSQCVFYGLPLLESGTLGTKCNCQVIVPDLTCSYADGPNDNDAGDAIPMCTLRNFPSTTEHCAEWARARFEDLFSTPAAEAANFTKDPAGWLESLKAKTVDLPEASKRINAIETELHPLRKVTQMVKRAASPDMCFALCVEESYETFFRLFRDPILSLVKTYPENAVDREGEPFWSGTKRFPKPLDFDPNDEIHMNFIISSSIILAVNYGLQPADEPLPAEHPWRSSSHVQKILSRLKPPPIVEEKVDMSGGGEEEAAAAANQMEMDEAATSKEFEALLADLENLSEDDSISKLNIEPAEFEKDDDSNGHIDLITAASNLRAINYRIKPAPRHEVKMIAGKIIPALATTTACVTGLVMIEMLKVLQAGKKVEAFKDSSNSLGINGYFFSEPSPPEKAQDEYDPIEMSSVRCIPSGFTKWAKTVVKEGALTVQEFLDAFKAKTGVNCTAILHPNGNRPGAQGNGKFVYEANAWHKKMKDVYKARLSKPLERVILEIYGEEALPPGKKFTRLEVSCEDDEGEPCKVPQVVYHL